MAIPVVQPMDFNLLELLNAVAQNLAAAPAHKSGRFYFDTVSKQLGISDGTSWTYVGQSGALDSEAVQDIVGPMFTGTSVNASYNDSTGQVVLSIPSNAVTNAMVAASAAITLDKLAETAGLKVMTAAERTKLTGIATGATVNSTDAALRDRSTHTGTQSADTITDGTTNKVYTAAEKSKLSGIAGGATANQADAYLLARANQTGTQPASTISDFSSAADARIANWVGAAPAALDTLNELATALGNDPNFAATVTASIALKANIADLKTVATSGSYNDLTNKPVYTTTIGNGAATSFVVTHNLNTRSVVVDVAMAATPFTSVIAQVDKTSVNAVTISFATAPTANQYSVTVQA